MAQFVALWLWIAVAGRLPAAILLPLARGAARPGWWLAPGLRRRLRANLRRVHGGDDRAAERDARRAAEAIALYYADLARGAHGRASALDALDGGDGIHHLFDALDRGRGVVVVSAHLGNPEALVRPLGALGLPLFVFTERLTPPRLHELVHRARAAPHVRYEPLGVGAVRGALAHLRSGGIVAILGDRDLTGHGLPVPLFGAQAPLPTGPVDIALRSGAPLVPAFVLRSGRGRYHATVLPEVPLDRAGDRRAATAAGMAAVGRALEAAIALDPGQWFGAAHPIWPDPPPRG